MRRTSIVSTSLISAAAAVRVVCTSHYDTENAAATSLAARPEVVTAATRASRSRPVERA